MQRKKITYASADLKPVWHAAGGYDALLRLRRAARLAAALYWIALLLYLLLSPPSTHDLSVLVPVSLGFFPGCYALMGLRHLNRMKHPFSTAERDAGPRRVTRSLAACAGLTALGMLLDVLFVLTHTGVENEAAGFVLLALALLPCLIGAAAGARLMRGLRR